MRGARNTRKENLFSRGDHISDIPCFMIYSKSYITTCLEPMVHFISKRNFNLKQVPVAWTGMKT